MDLSHTRMRRGLGGQTFSLAVTVVVQIASVSLFLHFWGTSRYGEWLVLATVPAWFVLADLGVVSAATWEATMRASRRDLDGARSVFRTAWAFVTSLSVAAAGALALAAAAAPAASWFGFDGLDAAAARTVLLLLLGHAFVHVQTGLFAMGLTAAGRYGLHAFLLAATKLAAFGLVASALALGAGPEAVAAVMAGVECAGFAVVAGYVRRHSPWLRHGLAGTSLAELRRLAAPALGAAGLAAGNALVIQGPVLVVGAVLGPGAVAVFSTLRLVARAPVMGANVVFATLRPEVALAHGQGDGARVRRLNTRAAQLALWLAGATCLALMVLGPALVELWTGAKVAVRQPLFALLLAAGAGTMLWTGVATALMATNHSQRISGAYVLAAGTALPVSAAAAHFAGASGVAAVAVAVELVVLALALKRTLALLDQRLADLARAALRPPLDALDPLRVRPWTS